MPGSLRWMPSLAMASLVTMTMLGCAASMRSRDDPMFRGGFISVTNNHYDAVRVYRVDHGFRRRLGTLEPMRSATYPLPAHIAVAGGNVRLLIDPVGRGRSFLTDPILIGPQQTLKLRVSAGVAQSYYWVSDR